MAFDAAGTPSDSAWTAYQLGELAFGAGDVAMARGWYARGLDLDPAYVPNLAGLAKVAWARGDDELAIARFNEVVGRYPSAEFVVALADLYRATGKPALADRQEAVVAAMHDLATANGVNVDLEIPKGPSRPPEPSGLAGGASTSPTPTRGPSTRTGGTGGHQRSRSAPSRSGPGTRCSCSTPG